MFLYENKTIQNCKSELFVMLLPNLLDLVVMILYFCLSARNNTMLSEVHKYSLHHDFCREIHDIYVTYKEEFFSISVVLVRTR